MKKIVLTVIGLLLIVSLMPKETLANEDFDGLKIISVDYSADLYEYARKTYLPHVYNLITSGELDGSLDEYNVGEGFVPISDIGDDLVVFPILKNNKIVAIYEIINYNGELISQLSVGYAECEYENKLQKEN